MRTGRTCALLCSVLLAWSADVAAQSTPASDSPGVRDRATSENQGAIEVLVAGSERRGFVLALRIQTAGFASVRVVESLEGASARARRAAAQSMLAGDGTRAVLWFESRRGDERRALYVVGRGPAGVRTEVFVASAESSFDDDRELALKVRQALDAIATGRPSPRGAVDEPVVERGNEQQPAAQPDPETRPPAVETPSGRSAPSGRWSWLEGRAALALPVGGPALQAALGAALGAGWRVPFGYVEGYGALAGATSQEQVDDSGRASAWDLSAAAGARAGVERGAWRLGGAAELGLRVAFASGESAAGTTGDGVSYIPTLLALAEAMWSPFASREPGWRLRLAAGFQLSLRRQRFAINERDVLDLGRARPVVQLGVIYRLP